MGKLSSSVVIKLYFNNIAPNCRTKPMVDDHGSSVVFSDIIKDTE